jgi:mannose-1-phosphate guanylyltransferase/phosphomannomutase
MKAVVMAGGEGTRLRPLTSNQPKPMVSIAGRPCMEHIIELLMRHGFDEVVVTVAFMPQAIRSYFGDGASIGVPISYSVEESPAGTAGSVKLASDELDDTFLVISGDALCDVDLSALVAFHREKGASVTVGLVSVDNPLEFGIVVTDEDGRIERFLEKPSWGQVFSDTINTGIYVVEPEVLRHVPADGPYDFSKDLFPLLLEMGRPMYGCVLEGYWQDIGNLDQYRQANFDALDGRVQLTIPGIRLRGNIWIGESTDVADLEQIEGPALIGNFCRIGAEASVGPYAVLGSSVTVREHATVARSVVDSSTYIGQSATVEGALLGRSCEVRPHARVREGAAIGDESTLGAESEVMPGVRIYPFKQVESGAIVDRNVVWESSRASAQAMTGMRLSGLVNVDLTPEAAMRIGMAFGTALDRGQTVVASRSADPAARLIKRALITGLLSTGVHVDDIRVSPAAVNRHLVRAQGYAAGIHVRTSETDVEATQIDVFERAGIQMTPAFEKEIAKHQARQEFRRAALTDIGELTYPARVAETYVDDLLRSLDVQAIRARRFRIVVDYGYSSASLILPLVLGALEVETVAARAFVAARPPDDRERPRDEVEKLVSAMGADFGVEMDAAGERMFLVDELGRQMPAEQELALFVRLLVRARRAGTIAVPITASQVIEELAEGSGLDVRRTQASLSALTVAAAEPGTIFAGAAFGGFVFPAFVPGYDAMASLGNLLELLAGAEGPLSALFDELPRSTVIHRTVPCPWSMKGTVMRVLTEQLKDRRTSTLDGIKVFNDGGWGQVIPDPDEPLLHLYAESADGQVERVVDELRAAVNQIVATQGQDDRRNPQAKVEGS